MGKAGESTPAKAGASAPLYVPRKGLTRKFFCAQVGHVDLDKLHPSKAEKLIKAGYITRQ
jgi:hypothetical protein